MNANEPGGVPERRRMGCIAKGCLSFVGLAVFLAIAFVGGGVWAVRHLRDTYSSGKPLALSTPAEPAPAVAATAAPVGATAAPIEPAAPPLSGESTPLPLSTDSRPVQARWKDFEKAAHRNKKARIELTAAEINTLLNDNSKVRGKASVSIADDIGHVQVSIPLDKVFMMGGRYFNGAATVQASPDGDPAKARISNVVIGGQHMADSVLDQSFFGSPTIRSYISDWLNQQDVATFQIRNNVVIGETRGQ
ncbi:MAG: hypothetical protein M3Y80_08710 [Verrucomicrobiota bacterium]|nr:hypothetical protein [Verrucomicrobiota bacterium]